MPAAIRKKALWTLAVVAGLLSLYALAGFLLVPRLLRTAIIDNGERYLAVRPEIGEIAFNPFLLQLEIKNCSLPDARGSRLIGFQRLFVDFEVASLWRRAYVFKAIELAAPFADAYVSSTGQLNLMALKPRLPQHEPTSSNQPLPRIEVGRLQVSSGSLSYTDASRPNVFTSKLQPIDFELRDFTTGADGGRFRFSGTSRLNERLDWRGILSVQPVASTGEFRLQGLQAATVWDYFKDRLNFAMPSGSLDVTGRYQFLLGDRSDLQLELSRVAVRDLAIKPKMEPQAEPAWISVPQLVVDGASLNLAQQRVSVAAVRLSDLKLRAWLGADGSVNLATLAGPANSAASAAGAAAPPAARASADTSSGEGATHSAWQFKLAEFAVANASVFASDRSLTTAATLQLSPLNLTVRGVSSDLQQPLAIEFDTAINETGKLALQGTLTPASTTAKFTLQVNQLDLTPLQPYIARQTAMTLHSGRLSSSGELKIGAAAPAAAAHPLQFAGNLAIDDLHTTDNELHKDFVNWKRLELRGLRFQSQPAKLSIEQVIFRKPYARVIIAPDRTLNISRVLAGAAAAHAGSAPAPAHTPLRSSASARASAPSAPSVMSLAVDIRKVAIDQGEANFADLSIQPNFAAGVRALDGTVLGLSSNPAARARVKLRGEVDRFSPVAIDGEVNPFSSALYTDLNLSFRNMELTTFNPYSGKFAGYSIAKGKLTTELHYKVQARKLEAQHHVIIDQLEFGPKTESKEAVTLPIKLAVALLKDRHGVIDINLPVSGTLDDPKFRLGPIIWKVVLNLLVKAVTAPFALLGALFGGGPDLQFIDFAPGIAELDAAAQTRVKAVSKALVERPQLKIEVPIAAVADVDRAALQDARFSALVSAEIVSLKLAKAPAAAAASPLLESFDAAVRLKILTSACQQQLGSVPALAEPPKDTSKEDALTLKLQTLEKALRSALVVTDAELRALAEQRAQAIQKELLADPGIDPARVFLAVNGKAKANGAQARLELTLQ